MSLDKKFTLFKDGEVETVIKKSRFICAMKKISTEDEAKEFIQQIKKTHYKANHNCLAFILGENMEIQRSSDDGEPSGTAGVPMLEVLKKNHLHNVVCVVTRYFGGVKLGSGGLIRAYSTSVSAALEELGIAQVLEKSIFEITVDYSLHGKMEYFLEKNPIYKLLDTNFSNAVSLEISVDKEKEEEFQKALISLLNAKGDIKKVDTRMVEEYFEMESNGEDS